ncbi:hypothetical protein NIES3804_41430 [Microcystis aeruginosa NIES-3804]|uniref:Uncharacterized protein n=1 Tax=Microcystis aeruginosa NIES-3804 TaxID=2517783 RepID=A0A6H9H1I1_MICAE|nr:hypothetical protein NIES3804_41430 [Microcystis aeruginosa NIES-3804]
MKVSRRSSYIKELADHLGCSVAVARKILRFFRIRRSQRKIFRPSLVREHRGDINNRYYKGDAPD